jgi:hypothetical protein
MNHVSCRGLIQSKASETSETSDIEIQVVLIPLESIIKE